MLTGLYSAATAMEASQQNHEIIARDLAHLGVPGYRGSIATFRDFDEVFDDALLNVSQQGHGVYIDEIHSDFAPGPIERTNRQLDITIQGDGFFEVSGSNGTTYTRNGVFFLSSEGVLVNANGDTVMGEGGEIRVPQPHTEADVVISPEGSVSAGGAPVGQLRIVEFSDPSQLVRASTTSFRPSEGIEPEASASRVQQGFREQSNVSAVEQLVRMIINMRQHDAAKQSINKIDESIGQLTDPQI